MRPRLGSTSSVSSVDSVDSASSASSVDEDEINSRIAPCWDKYRCLIERRGFRLDTFRDVKQYYERRGACNKNGYMRACKGGNPDALCRDAGLPDNLFRGTRIRDGKAVIVKAVHLRSREFDTIRVLSTPPLRDDPLNHTIPVLDLIEEREDDVGFIVQEEWSSQLVVSSHSCPLRDFLKALRQCIMGVVFMHSHNIAHLDISLHNVLTDYQGHYRYIDFELSRRYDGVRTPRVRARRGAELPPELERGEESDPFKVDIWALAVLILRACKMTGHDVPELVELTRPMLHNLFEARPTARMVLQAFDRVASRIPERRLQMEVAL